MKTRPPQHITPSRLPLDLILPLRTQVLRPHFPSNTLAHFEGDSHHDTIHYGTIHPETTHVIACATVMQNPSPKHLEYPHAAQLRGMAVSPEYQGQGLGQTLLHFILNDLAKNTPTQLLWCNARMSAAHFYTSQQFDTDGEVFQVHEIGPHQVMWAYLSHFN